MLAGKPRKPEDNKVCLGCYQKVAGRGVDCPGCKWPMCGKKKCWEEGSEHALGECALLMGARERIPANYQNLWDPNLVYQSITVLRFLSLKEHDPSKWEELMHLKRCISPLNLSRLETLTRMKIVPLVNNYFLNVAVPEEWIVNIITFLSANTFGLPDSMVRSQLSNFKITLNLLTYSILIFVVHLFNWKPVGPFLHGQCRVHV